MNYFYLVFKLALTVGLHAGASEPDFALVERLTNLKVRHVIDTCCDYVGEEYWSFGHGGGMDLMTWMNENWSHDGGLATAWLVDQVRRGRIRNLGNVNFWRESPRRYPINLSGDPDGNWIILTDLEPDDRVALMYLSRALPRSRVLAVGVNLLDAGAKSQRARTLLDHLGWTDVPVVTGNGGDPSSYPQLPSNAAALSFDEDHRSTANHPPRSSNDLQAFIQDAMVAAQREGKKINVLVLSPGTDLANALLSLPAAAGVINRTVLTGGWVEVSGQDGAPQRRSTYNVNMDPVSARVILERLPVELISSHLIKPTFGGGSLNAKTAPEIAHHLESSAHPALVDFREAGGRWDTHLIKTIPPLAAVVGPFAGRQFTPADVVAAALVVDPTLAVNVDARHHQRLIIPDTTYRGTLTVPHLPKAHVSRTTVVEKIDRARFLETLQEALTALDCEAALAKEGSK